MFHLVSLSLQICLARALACACVGVACFWLVLFLVGFFLPGKFDFNLMLIPVVDRPVSHLSGNAGKKNVEPRLLQISVIQEPGGSGASQF